MFYPTFEQVQEYADKGYDLIPVSLSIFADMDTPISAFRKNLKLINTAFFAGVGGRK